MTERASSGQPVRRAPILLRIVLLAVAAAGLLPIGILLGSWYFKASMREVAVQGARVVLTPIYARLYSQDLVGVKKITAQYRIGDPKLLDASAVQSWRALERHIDGFAFQWSAAVVDHMQDVPFVYESGDAPFLAEFRDRFRLETIVSGAADEYAAMLKLAAWLGTRWDHGTDPLEGTTQVCDPVRVVEAGEQGAKYWCEVAARTTVHAAAALGWPGRVITASRDGYTWEHAVAELWSNRFNKWFVVDTDFNVVYEHDGVPLSAFELSRDGLQLQRRGLLNVRVFAPPKPNLPIKDLLPFYAYVHVDLRNDWCLRTLSAGSPAGGDLSTWWTARPSIDRLLTAKIRNDDARQFNWHVNSVAVHARAAAPMPGGALDMKIALVGYSPVFRSFEVSVDNGPWRMLEGSELQLQFAGGVHSIRARIMTISGYIGPESKVDFSYTASTRGA